MEHRNPNTFCVICETPVYRRPSQMHYKAYCSDLCRKTIQLAFRECICGEEFKPKRNKQKFCSRKCSNRGRTGICYTREAQGNKSRKRLALLKQIFDFKSCMIEGCSYWQTYDIHRHISGQKGGEYVIGNMFAICPNHHAEITRGLTLVLKIDDHTLRILARKRDDKRNVG